MPLLITYCKGPDLDATKDITKGGLVNVCEDLNKEFDEANLEPPSKKRKRSKTEPEKEKKKLHFKPWVEGGIEYVHERENGEARKYVKICFATPYKTPPGSNKWPWRQIDTETLMADWRDNTDVVFKKGQCTDTYIKAWEPAPMFTKQELKIFFEVLEKHGLKRDGKIPFKYELDHQARTK